MDTVGTIVGGIIVLGFMFFFFDGHEAIAAIWIAKADIARNRRREAKARAKEAKYKALIHKVEEHRAEPSYRAFDDREPNL